jgi:hypothetical protein
MDNLRTPEEARYLIDYLVSKGKRSNSFENAFPRIHHSKSLAGTLIGHLKYINGPNAVKSYSSQTNQNIVRRMEIIKSLVDDFLITHPESVRISEYKYHALMDKAVEEIPFK